MQPLWRNQVVRALEENSSVYASRFVQIATINANNRPANRTLAFRGLVDEQKEEDSSNGSVLKFVTDLRSDKISQLVNSPFVEACWWFPVSKEQFRIAGRMSIVFPPSKKQRAKYSISTMSEDRLERLRLSTWKEVPDTTRAQFSWPTSTKFSDSKEGPGAGKSENLLLSLDLIGSSSTQDEKRIHDEALENFCVVLLEADRVDHLDLKNNSRTIYFLDDKNKGTWKKKTINPGVNPKAHL